MAGEVEQPLSARRHQNAGTAKGKPAAHRGRLGGIASRLRGPRGSVVTGNDASDCGGRPVIGNEPQLTTRPGNDFLRIGGQTEPLLEASKRASGRNLPNATPIGKPHISVGASSDIARFYELPAPQLRNLATGADLPDVVRAWIGEPGATISIGDHVPRRTVGIKSGRELLDFTTHRDPADRWRGPAPVIEPKVAAIPGNDFTWKTANVEARVKQPDNGSTPLLQFNPADCRCYSSATIGKPDVAVGATYGIPRRPRKRERRY